MSNDEQVSKDLIQTLKDGQEGFSKGADRLAQTARIDLCERFRQLSAQRASMAEQLRIMAAAYGDDIDDSGTLAGALHRGWMAVKDAFAGADPEGVLDVAEQGEDHTVAAFKRALEEDISPDLRAVVAGQFADVRAAHDWVRDQRNAVD